MTTKRNMKNNIKGSALLYVLILMLVGTILGTAVLSISFSYAMSIENERKEGQAYYTAKSVCDSVYLELQKGTSEIGLQSSVISNLKNVGDKLEITNITLPSNAMGEVVEAYIEYIGDNNYVITVKVIYEDEVQVLSLKVKRIRDAVIAEKEMFQGLDVGNIEIENFNIRESDLLFGISNTTEYEGSTLNVDGDMIMSDYNWLKKDSTWNIQGDLYTSDGTLSFEENAKVTLGTKEFSKELKDKISGTDSEKLKNADSPDSYINEKPEWINGRGMTPVNVTSEDFAGGSTFIFESNTFYSIDNASQWSIDLDDRIRFVENGSPAIIVLKEGSQLLITGDTFDMPTSDTDPEAPRVLFYLEEGAELTIPASSNVAIYGENDSILYIKSPNTGSKGVYGQIKVDTISLEPGAISSAQYNYYYNPISIKDYYVEKADSQWVSLEYEGGYYE